MKGHPTIFTMLIKTGIFFGYIQSKVSDLRRVTSEHLMMHNLYEHFSSKNTNRDAINNLKNLKIRIDFQVKEINEMIKKANNIMKLTIWKEKIPLIDKNALNKLFKERFSEIYKDGSSQNLGNENFKIKMDKVLFVTSSFQKDFFNTVEHEYYFEGLDKLQRDYRTEIDNAIDLLSVAHFKTSIFVVGRTLESCINSLLKLAMKLKKVKKLKFDNLKYENKIGLLGNSKIIDEKFVHELNSIRIDRNESGHPNRKTFSFNDNRLVISKSISLLLDLQKKLNSLKSNE